MRNPLYAFVAFLVAEGLIAAGFINRTDAQSVQTTLEETLFYIFLALASLAGLKQYFDTHKHHITTDANVKKTEIKNEDTVLKTEPAPDHTDGGTPPVNSTQPGQ